MDEPDGRLGDVVADDEVHFTDVEALLADAGGHQGVVPAGPESPHNLDLLPLTQALLPCVPEGILAIRSIVGWC